MLSAYNLGNQRCRKYLPAVHSPSGEAEPHRWRDRDSCEAAPRGARGPACGPRVGEASQCSQSRLWFSWRKEGRERLFCLFAHTCVPVASFPLVLISFLSLLRLSSHQLSSLKQQPVLTPRFSREGSAWRRIGWDRCASRAVLWAETLGGRTCIQVMQVRSVSMVADSGGWSPGSRGCPIPWLQACFLHHQTQQSLSCFHRLYPRPHPTVTSLFCSFPAFKHSCDHPGATPRIQDPLSYVKVGRLGISTPLLSPFPAAPGSLHAGWDSWGIFLKFCLPAPSTPTFISKWQNLRFSWVTVRSKGICFHFWDNMCRDNSVIFTHLVFTPCRLHYTYL